MKSSFIHHAFKTIINIRYNVNTNTITESDIEIKASNMLREVEQKLEKFFMRYKELYGNESSQEERVGDVVPRDDGNDYLGAFLNVGGNSMSVENELKRYSGIQISTVASESAFSTSGRILDVYRTNLSSIIVEAFICTKDWVRKASKPIVDDIDDILHDDDIACAIEEALRAPNIIMEKQQCRRMPNSPI